MHLRRMMASVAFAAGLAALPLTTANAQYYPPPCSPFPLLWPFCVAGAVIGVAATIVTAPFRAFAGPPPPYGYYGSPGYPPPPNYPPPGYYYPPGNYPPPYGPR